MIIGGSLGHALCTGLAVLGGRFIAQRISVRTGRSNMCFQKEWSPLERWVYYICNISSQTLFKRGSIGVIIVIAFV